MTESYRILSELIPAACLGFGLGWLYFAGLWLTLRCAARSSQPGLLLMVSLLLRLSLVGLGLYLLAGGHWHRYLATVPGMWLARKFCISRFAPRGTER